MEIFAILLILFGLWIYFLPAFIANNRGRAPGPIFLLNLLLGWTLVGWVIAIVWACTERTAKEDEARKPANDYVGPAEQARRAAAASTPKDRVTLSDAAIASFGGPGTTDTGAMGKDPEDSKRHFGKKIADNLGWPLALQYRDASGHESVRRIDVDALYADDGGFIQYFTAFCHQSEERRTFRPERAIGFAAYEDAPGEDGVISMRTESLADYLRARLDAEHPPEA